MIDTAVTQPDSAPVTEKHSDEFAKYASEANARDLAKRRGEMGLPSKEDSAPSKTEPAESTQPAEAAEKETEETAVTGEASAASESETAAASEAASTQEKKKISQASESRWAKITRENRELRERLEKIERGTSQRDTPQTSQAAPPANQPKVSTKPRFEDVDDKGQPKYKSYADYEDARDTWLREDVKREIAEGQTKSQREAEQRQVQQTIQKEFQRRVTEAKKKYEDFDDVALQPDLPIKQGSAVDAFILDSEQGTDVLYHLGQNPQELERINKLNPVAQIRELAKIEAKFSTPPVRRITSAPPPPKTVNATSSPGADAVATALKGDDFQSYRDSANARDIARRRGK